MLSALQHILANLGFREDVGAFIVLFGLVVARLVSAITLSPFLGGRNISPRIKVGLAVVVSIVLFPTMAPRLVAGELTVLRATCLLIKESVIGATIGFLSQLVFQGIQMAGAMMDYARGMSQATFLAPQLESNVSLIGQLQLQASLVLFLILNGHLLFLRALAASFQKIPLLEFPHFTGGTLGVMEQLGRYSAETLEIAVRLSAPVLLALFLVDIGFGMLGKVAQGLNVHNESQPVKALFGLGVFLLALAYVVGRMPNYFTDMVEEVRQFVAYIS
jgi:flagellar biosynthetic protein FliR